MHSVGWTAGGHPKGRSEAEEPRSGLTRRRPSDTPGHPTSRERCPSNKPITAPSDTESALTAWPKTPAALVLPVSDEAEESTTRRVEQAPVQHVVRVGVSVMVSAPNDRTGARGRWRLSALLAQARQALAGWTPPGQREVLSFRRGRLVSLEDGRLQWLDEYEIRRVARAGVVETE